MKSEFYARLVLGTDEEIDQIVELAKKAGKGMTSLPIDKRSIGQKILNCAKTIEGSIKSGEEYLMFVLCQKMSHRERIIGVSTITGKVGQKVPYHSFKVLGKPKVLALNTELGDSTIIGGLYVDDEFRNSGVGKLISKIRYMYMAQFSEMFSNNVISEIRGAQKGNHCLFYDNIMEPFIELNFDKVNDLIANKGREPILNKLPKNPIYVDLLTSEAKLSLQGIHYESKGAHKMLLKEGFTCKNDLDLLDGGPIMSCPTKEIKTIANSSMQKKKLKGINLENEYIVSNTSKKYFKAISTKLESKNYYLGLDENTLEILGVNKGDELRFSPIYYK